MAASQDGYELSYYKFSGTRGYGPYGIEYSLVNEWL